MSANTVDAAAARIDEMKVRPRKALVKTSDNKQPTTLNPESTDHINTDRPEKVVVQPRHDTTRQNG